MSDTSEIVKSLNLKLPLETYSKLRRLQEELLKKGHKVTLAETIEGCIKNVNEKGIINTSYWTK